MNKLPTSLISQQSTDEQRSWVPSRKSWQIPQRSSIQEISEIMMLDTNVWTNVWTMNYLVNVVEQQARKEVMRKDTVLLCFVTWWRNICNIYTNFVDKKNTKTVCWNGVFSYWVYANLMYLSCTHFFLRHFFLLKNYVWIFRWMER